jgi:hypothetical protein
MTPDTRTGKTGHCAHGAALHTAPMFDEKREAPREAITLPVRLDDGRVGITRDIGPTGMFLEIEGPPPADGTVVFEMEVPETGLKFSAHGWIVRVEQHSGRTGLAVQLVDPRLETIGSAPEHEGLGLPRR